MAHAQKHNETQRGSLENEIGQGPECPLTNRQPPTSTTSKARDLITLKIQANVPHLKHSVFANGNCHFRTGCTTGTEVAYLRGSTISSKLHAKPITGKILSGRTKAARLKTVDQHSNQEIPDGAHMLTHISYDWLLISHDPSQNATLAR